MIGAEYDFLSGRVSWPGITHPDDVPRLEKEVAGFMAKGQREFGQRRGDGGELSVERLPPRLRALAAGEPRHFQIQRAEPSSELAVMLLDQDLGWRHHRHLTVALHGLQGRQGGDDRFAAAHIALQQALQQMAANPGNATLLSAVAREQAQLLAALPPTLVAMLAFRLL